MGLDPEIPFVPFVSVLITCRNQGAYLKEAIGSIDSKIAFEILIIDDGSDEKETLEILDDFRANFKVLRQEKQNMGAARNLGFSVSKGKFLVVMAANMVLRYDCINSGVPFMTRFPRIGAMYGDWILRGEKPIRQKSRRFNRFFVFRKNYFFPCVIIRRSTWMDAKGFDEHLPFEVDLDWAFWLQAIRNNARFLNYPKLFYEAIEKPEVHRNAVFRDRKKRLISQIYLNHKKELAVSRLYEIKKMSKKDMQDLKVMWNISLIYGSVRGGSYAHFKDSFRQIWKTGNTFTKIRAFLMLIGFNMGKK